MRNASYVMCNVRTTDSGKKQTGCVSSMDELKQVCKGSTTKIPYRVGYDWNRGGRLKELRKRHLGRKFLKIWILNTFGQILPHTAKSHRESVVLRRAFEGWKDEWWTSRKEWCLATRADCHYRYYLYNLAFQHWQTFLSLQKEKKSKFRHAVQFADRQLMRLAWNRWEILRNVWMKKRMLESALELKRLKTLQSAWHVWRTRLLQHQNLHTMEKQLVKQREKTSQQRMFSEHWELWQDCVVEAVDKHFQPLGEKALTDNSTFLRRSCFNQWRERLAERRHMQEADICFAGHMLSSCFKSWVESTLQGSLQRHRKHKADIYNQQRLYKWVFNTWWAQREKHKDRMLSERIAVLHEERSHLQRAWRCWKEKTNTKGKQTASSQISPPHKILTQKSSETQDRVRGHQHQQACPHSDLVLHGRKRTAEKCEQTRCLQEHQVNSHIEEPCNCLRSVVSVWRDKAMLLKESIAQNHYQHFLQYKVFIAWREATESAVSTHHQQGESLARCQMSINQVWLQQCFRQWRKEAELAHTEKTYMERARWHYESKQLSKAMQAWTEHHNQLHINKVMKRQGTFLLRLKMYQKFFDLWKIKLQHRRREAELTERALWHWSLTLQAKVLCGWRRWVTGQQKAARDALAARDEPLMGDVKSCLTYAAHMKDLTAGPAEDTQKQESLCVQKRLERTHRVVRNCALHWKQRALCKPHTGQGLKEDPQKRKSVTFSCTTPELTIASPADPAEQEDEVEELRKLLANRAHRRQPRRPPLLESPEPALSHPHPVSSMHHTDVLLGESTTSRFPQSSAYPDVRARESIGSTEGGDPASSLITELLDIQRDMNSYQQDRKQLRTWKKLKEVLHSWTQTSGRDDQAEKNAVCQELKELEERIHRLSTELAKQKPKMLLQAERIQHLQATLTHRSEPTASR